MKKTFIALLFIIFVSIFATSCSEQVAMDAPDCAVRFTDDLGREVALPSPPQRVAALIGSFADIWCLAGGHDMLVAAANDAWTSFSLDLGENVQNLGAIKEPSLEILLAQNCDLVLASSNTSADVALIPILEEAGVPVACFDVQNLQDYLRMLKLCTKLTGREENYALYGETVLEEAQQAIARQDGRPISILCMRVTGSSCKVKGSSDFLLGEMLRDLGCMNVADSNDSMLDSLSLESIVSSDPDYIFAVLQGSDSSAAQDTMEKALLSNPAWQNLRAVKEGRFYTLDHELFNLKPNARWGEAYQILADILYP